MGELIRSPRDIYTTVHDPCGSAHNPFSRTPTSRGPPRDTRDTRQRAGWAPDVLIRHRYLTIVKTRPNRPACFDNSPGVFVLRPGPLIGHRWTRFFVRRYICTVKTRICISFARARPRGLTMWIVKTRRPIRPGFDNPHCIFYLSPLA